MRKVGYVVLGILALSSVFLSVDNVFSDADPITRLAEEAACRVKPCGAQHGMTRMERTPFGQSFEFTWRDGTVQVSCSRSYLLAGERECRAEK